MEKFTKEQKMDVLINLPQKLEDKGYQVGILSYNEWSCVIEHVAPDDDEIITMRILNQGGQLVATEI